MTSARVVHFEIHASEPAKLVEFYSTVFGWKIEQYGEVPYWLITAIEGDVDNENPAINGAITERMGPPPAPDAPINGAVLVVGTDKVDELFSAALAAGATVAIPLEDMEGVGRVGYIKDPDGNVIGMITPDMSQMPERAEGAPSA